jgi:hypothetical protein
MSEDFPSINAPKKGKGLSNFVDEKTGKLAGPIKSPRSLTVIKRLGYLPTDLYPRNPKALFEKGYDNDETLAIKYESFEKKRLVKVEECAKEYEIIKEFTKYATVKDYVRLPIKQHWLPTPGDPTDSKNKKTNAATMSSTMGNTTGGGGGNEGKSKTLPAASSTNPEAIRMMAEAAANRNSQMMKMEEAKVEAIKRRQQKDIARVIDNESRMADLQAKIIKSENDEAERAKEHTKKVSEAKKARAAKKKKIDDEKNDRLDEEVRERDKMAAKEMDVEIKVSAQEREKIKKTNCDSIQMEKQATKPLCFSQLFYKASFSITSELFQFD